MLVNVVPAILGGTAPPSSLLFCNPIYRARWWWREFGRVSYLGGRDYHEPVNLSIEHQTARVIKNTDATSGLVTNTTEVAKFAYQALLFRHDREQVTEYENRRKRAYYNNVVRTVANSLVSHALKLKPTRVGDDQMQAFWSGVDPRRSLNMDKFVSRGAQQAEVQGIMWACVDNRTQAKGGDGNPYAYWVSPLDILDWEVDEGGNIVWLKQFCFVTASRGHKDPVVPRFRFRIWTRTDVQTIETDINGGHETPVPDQSGPNEIGEVPFVPLYSVREEDSLFPEGHARLGDFCKAANHAFNLSSLLSEILYKQTFSWMIFPSKDVDVLQTGTGSALGWDAKESGGAMPNFVSPDADQARVLIESIRDVLEQARQGIGVGRGRQEGSMEKSSAAALELESDDKRAVLMDIASECQDFERRLCRMVNLYRNVKTPEQQPTIEYPTDFNVRSLQVEIDEALAMDKLGISPEIKLKLVEQIVGRKFSQLAEDEKAKLIGTLKADLERRAAEAAKIAAGGGKPPGDDGEPGAGDKGDGKGKAPFPPGKPGEDDDRKAA